MNKIVINEVEYELEKDFQEGYDEEIFKERWTEDFKDYDYIVGDFSYNKLRLKGFYSKKNPKVREHNSIEDVDKYIEKNCAYQCRYFILKKIK